MMTSFSGSAAETTLHKGGVRYGNQGTFSPVLDQLDELMTKGAEASKRAGR